MILGGSVYQGAIFKHILSIGYEFESHDITKLSLHETKKWLINSDLTLRTLKEKMKTGNIKAIHRSNYLEIRIPIHKEGAAQEDVVGEHIMQAAEEENVEDIDEDKEKEIWENESYKEYFSENRKSDIREWQLQPRVAFNVTNDQGEIGLDDILKEKCASLDIHKNDMYVYRAKTKTQGVLKDYKIKFTEDITKDCESFSGVEYIVTYYEPQNPRRENANIIMETYADACSRILDHISDLEVVSGQLVIDKKESYDQKGYYQPIAYLDEEMIRKLYKKPNTNLYYMDIYDDIDTDKNTLKKFEDIEFIPQMTFRCKTENAINIMKHMLKPEQKELISLISGRERIPYDEDIDGFLAEDYETIQIIEGIVDNLIIEFNKTHENVIAVDTVIGQRFKTYVFFIFFKLYNFIVNHSKILSGEDYLKDQLTFASRHGNYDFYLVIKDMFKNHYKIENVEEIYNFFYQPEILKVIYDNMKNPPDNPADEDYTEQGDYKYEGAFVYNNVITEKEDPNYGNPLYSIGSYFKYFEDPVDASEEFKPEHDWLIVSKKDTYSTTFELKNDEILLENRLFRYEIEYVLNMLIGAPSNEGIVTIGGMRDIVKHIDRKYNLGIENKMMFTKRPFKAQFTGGRTRKYNKKARFTQKKTKKNQRKTKKQ